MSPEILRDRQVAVVATSVVCPTDIGSPTEVFAVANSSVPSSVKIDPRLRDLGLKQPFAARCSPSIESSNLASALILQAFGALAGLDTQGRWGLAIGTSSGAMTEMCEAFSCIERGFVPDPSHLARATYDSPFFDLQRAIQRQGFGFTRSMHCLSACAASTIAIGLGFEWIRQGHVDAAIVGGYDALSDFVAIGFESLGATTRAIPPRPLRADRTGLALGEGAALLVLMAAEKATNPLAWITGFGLACDAIHLTAPDRHGRGMARAIELSLQDSPEKQVDFISMHATGTAFNDAMEACAIHTAIPTFSGIVHAAKATLGHALGASGAIETALIAHTLRAKVLPATTGEGPIDPALSLRALDVSESADVQRALKLSAAFGGVNAAICLHSARPQAASPKPAIDAFELASFATLDAMALDDLAQETGVSRDRFGRMDPLCHLALTGLARICESIERESLQGAGIVLATHFSTLATNLRFYQSYAKKGVSGASGRAFAYTTPNAVLGECSIAYRLTGPSIAVSGDLGQANEVAHQLIECGLATTVVALSADFPSELAKTWASACDIEPAWGVRVTVWRAQCAD